MSKITQFTLNNTIILLLSLVPLLLIPLTSERKTERKTEPKSELKTEHTVKHQFYPIKYIYI